MKRLFSYCIPVDDGAAPNPFWDYCTLAICKPAIRRVAQIGDWVVGTGSRHSPIGDISGYLVYAMRVTEKRTMEEYDSWVKRNCRKKIPDREHRDHRRRLGDAIYHFESGRAQLRSGRSVHKEKDLAKDLGGKYVLISDEFYYFGDNPIALPPSLRRLAQQCQGHRSNANNGLLEPFLKWLHKQRLKPGKLYGKPQWKLSDSSDPTDCEEPARGPTKC